MAQAPEPQADVLWQSDDGTAKFCFTLQAHGQGLGQEYSRFGAEGAEFAALPQLPTKGWEHVSGHVKTFMARLGSAGYSIDLQIPRDVEVTGRADACTFGCGADETRLRQVRPHACSLCGYFDETSFIRI